MNNVRITTKYFIMLTLFTALLTMSVHAHPGKTDGSGGHWNRSTGEYHYHHGYSEHSHYDMNGDGVVDCPYDFKDITKHNSTNNSSKLYSSNSSNYTTYSNNSSQNNASITPVKEEWEMPIWLKWAIGGLIAFSSVLLFYVRNLKGRLEDQSMEAYQALEDLKRAQHAEVEQHKKEIESLNSRIAGLKKIHAQEIKLSKEQTAEKLKALMNDMEGISAKDILRLTIGIPDGDYLDPYDWPCSNDAKQLKKPLKWGSKYTYCVSSSYTYKPTAKYHTPDCRHAIGLPQINAYEIKRNPHRFHPCSVCKPTLPNTSWVDKYLERKQFFKEHGIDT